MIPLDQPWAIARATFHQIVALCADPERLEAAVAQLRVLEQSAAPFEVKDGVAVIGVEGPLTKRSSLLSFLFGGSTFARIERDLNIAMNSAHVRAIVLSVDSPGGTVDGCRWLPRSAAIWRTRGAKSTHRRWRSWLLERRV